MYNYKLIIQYDGGRYKGWQRLGGTEDTIQAKIEQVISKMLDQKTEIIGCSRTDAGVHALAQVANFKSEMKQDITQMMKYLNHYLPQDICITQIEAVEENFHARYHVKNKTYLYKIWNKEYSNPFMRKYSMLVADKLDLQAMQAACRCFIGTHDFTAFSNAKSKKKSMVREIYDINIVEEEGFILIRLCGNGFLYNMARWIVGTLIDIGIGRLNVETIPAMLESKDRSSTGNLADACGLYLEKVTY